MIRHVVMFKFKPETPESARQAFVAKLHALTDDIPVIRALEIGENFAEGSRACDIVLMVDVENEADLETYSNHPDHQPVKQLSVEICSASHVVDYILPT